MKRATLLLLLFAFLLHGCGSAKRSLSKGNYDDAVEQAVKAIRRNPKSEKDIINLQQAMTTAIDQDNERIRYLKSDGRDDSWDEIYQIYKKMYDRQSLVGTVTPLQYNNTTIEFPYVDYLEEMAYAKRKAADYLYAHGQELMTRGNKESYRQAYDEFVKVKDYIGDYNNIDNEITEARYLGTSRALVVIENHSELNFPEEYKKELLNIDIASFSRDWVEFYATTIDQNVTVDYLINVNINVVAVSPDYQVQADSVVKKRVQDGFEYEFDARGNVKKDSLGNDIKKIKYKEIQCAIVQTFQNKECTIQGVTEIVSLNPQKVLKTEPLAAVSSFEHASARAIGDVEALDAKLKEMTKVSPLPFPSDLDMIYLCSDALKAAIRSSIQRNRYNIK